jgi:hypothetical protein
MGRKENLIFGDEEEQDEKQGTVKRKKRKDKKGVKTGSSW